VIPFSFPLREASDEEDPAHQGGGSIFSQTTSEIP
jgi:hypothetical protein